LRWGSVIEKDKIIDINVPADYAQKFDHAGLLSPSDKIILSQNIGLQISRQLSPDISNSWISSKTAFIRNEQVPKSTRALTSMEVQASSSPESVNQVNVDSPENLALAKLRGNFGKNLVVGELEKIGIKVDPNLVKISPKESKFTADKWTSLVQMANSIGIQRPTEAEKVLGLISLYNSDQIQNSSMLEKLDSIVASKRAIKVSVGLDEKSEQVSLFPLPILGLLAAIRRKDIPKRDKKVKDKKNNEDKFAKPEKPKPEEKQSRPKYEYDSPVTHQERWDVVVRDIAQNFGKKSFLKQFAKPSDFAKSAHKVSYREIAEDLKKNYHKYDSFEERQAAVADKILTAWKTCDIEARKNAGFSGDELYDGLNYHEQPHQIRQANIHAEELIKLVKEKIEGLPWHSYDYHLKKRIENLRNGGSLSD
jgi:hypothetical protein